MNWSGIDEPIYTRNGGVNQRALEKELAATTKP